MDASNLAVGGVLSQMNDKGESHPVAYYSKSLEKSQRNWSTHSEEAYALVMAVRQWLIYLMVHLRNTKDPRGKISRWINELEEYSYRIEYRPGKSNFVADALWRNLVAEDIPPNWEEKIYLVIELSNEPFKKQLLDEQNKDPVI